MQKEIKDKLEKILEKAKGQIDKIESGDSVEKVKVDFLGRKSELNEILKGIKDLSVDDKREVGPLANKVRGRIEELIKRKAIILEEKEVVEKEWVDVTMSGKLNKHEERRVGTQHVIMSIQREIEEIFTSMSFVIGDGPEIETEWYNFTALNIPEDHPARDMQDTFWLKQEISQPNKKNRIKILPRTQMSGDQVRFMEKNKPPFRLIVPGRVYRNEATDATHEHTFHQFEALVVDKNISVANFKNIAKIFFSEFFKKNLDIRLRPSYFPFTEPSFEFDISCTMCEGKGCRGCKQTGWLEVGGCGMVNQRVFESAGYERNEWQGFAWGFGLERLAMMKYKIDDIRLFMSGDLRFLRQF